MREWQKDDRKGKDAQIVASHVGHDLAYGVSSFRRPRRDPDLAGASGEGDRLVEPTDGDPEMDERADSAA
jgi:hypothetical protein